MPASPRPSSPWSTLPHGHEIDGHAMGDMSGQSRAPRTSRGTSPGKRALNWFSRSRSTSPNPNAMEDESPSAPASPSSFVVRQVVRQPGGVSHPYGEKDASTQDNHVQQVDQPHYPYRQSKSKPLSLGVPPGGPGGGVGYGTAQSTNDGRPELMEGPMTQERGRSRSPSPARPVSPGSIKAGAFRAGGRVSPAPLSPAQAAQQRDELRKRMMEEQQQIRSTKDVNRFAPERPSSATPSEGMTHQRSHSPAMMHSTSDAAPPAKRMDRLPTGTSVPVRIPSGTAPPPVIPLEGLPTPVKVPLQGSRLGPYPFGGPHSPIPSAFATRSCDDDGQHSPSTDGPHPATKWFKGLFGRSPRYDGQTEGMTAEEAHWMRHDRPFRGGLPGQAPTVRTSSGGAGHWSDGLPLTASDGSIAMLDSVEAEAMSRKRHSMMVAARIEDQHRAHLMDVDTPSKRGTTRPDRNGWNYTPRKVSAGRKAAPHANVSAPPVAPTHGDRFDHLEGPLTPAQQIMADARAHGDQTKPAPASSAASPAKATKPNGGGMRPGEGPLPSRLPVETALDEMMLRFYRFEGYAVPLLRSFEARLLDVERDNQMALNQDSLSINSGRDREMDRWVGQMAAMMRHEVAQLQAATEELRQARQMLGTLESVDKAPLRGTTPSTPSKTATTASAASPAKGQVSPNGRPRYTSALGRPLQTNVPTSPVASETSSTSRRAVSVDDRLKALVSDRASVTPADEFSAASAQPSTRLASANPKSVTPAAVLPKTDSQTIGEDYRLTMAFGQDEEDEATVDQQQSRRVKMSKEDRRAQSEPHGQLGHQGKAVALSTSTLDAPKSVKMRSSLSPLLPSMPLGLATPTRQRSVSPASMVPAEAGATIRTAQHATPGLRVRAQSYLDKADQMATHSQSSSTLASSASDRQTLTASPKVLGASRQLNSNGPASSEFTYTASVYTTPSKDKTVPGKVNATRTPKTAASLSVSVPASPAGRPTIRDRVAFFDAQR